MSTRQMRARVVNTNAFSDQKPGTSGLRKPTKTFMQPHYTENFVQGIFNLIDKDFGLGLPKGGENTTSSNSSINNDVTLIIGGDGRYHNKHVIQHVIIPMAAANRVARLIIGQNGILSTPAASHLIRHTQQHNNTQQRVGGGILLTASHNPGGLNADFGVKFNAANGGPAPEKMTNQIHAFCTQMTQYRTCDLSLSGAASGEGAGGEQTLDLSQIGETHFVVQSALNEASTSWHFCVEIVDSVQHYLVLMREIFDFPRIRQLIVTRNLRMIADAMHGVMGPYVLRILCDELGVPRECARNCEPLEDFGGGHPDPNLTYAADLVQQMRRRADKLHFGCAFDGDGDRNMILGRAGFFVNPCDSLGVVASRLSAIPFFGGGVLGLARSMPTSGAVDRVAQKLGLNVYEVPTGWKFFGNLMDAGKLSLCGEESFGMGSNHIREKDGLWAVLAWLSILANEKCATGSPSSTQQFVSVETLLQSYWAEFGRNFFTRYDYEQCSDEAGAKFMANLRTLTQQSSSTSLIGQTFSMPATFTAQPIDFCVRECDDFAYTDPIDRSHTANQGVRVLFTDGSRIVFRLSGTGSSGATIRVYIEYFSADAALARLSTQQVLEPLVQLALKLSSLQEITGKTEPTVIT